MVYLCSVQRQCEYILLVQLLGLSSQTGIQESKQKRPTKTIQNFAFCYVLNLVFKPHHLPVDPY